MDISLSLGILGTLASLAGLLVAGVQTIRLRELKRRTNADVWQSINMTRSMLGKLEQSAAFKQGESNLSEVYGKLGELFRQLIKQAVLDEKRFTEDTIRRWRSSGRLANDWQTAQARIHLQTDDIRITPPAGHPA